MEETQHFDRSQYHTLKRAIETIAGVCDGAITRDNAGYNGPDAPLGHLLAFLTLDAWPPGAFYKAWIMLRKYRLQLARCGIIYDDLPEPPCLQTHDRSISRLTTGEFLVLFPRDKQLILAFKKIPGTAFRAHPVRHRIVYEVPGAGKALLEFAERYNFDCMPSVRTTLELLSNDCRVTLEEGWFAIDFPKNFTTNAEIKAIRGWRTSTHLRFHWLLPRSTEARQELRAFLERHPEFWLQPEVKPELFVTQTPRK